MTGNGSRHLSGAQGHKGPDRRSTFQFSASFSTALALPLAYDAVTACLQEIGS